MLKPVQIMPDGPLNWLDIDLLDFRDTGPRFVLAGEEDGSWTVMDQATNMPAFWNDQLLFGLDFERADDLVETMNQLMLDIRQA
ncbi:MAG: hypothetical protein KDJ87_18040 [Rhizobiaceae bacterium]|nr:hypothetical protein [Rhizobiaceae bacterium]